VELKIGAVYQHYKNKDNHYKVIGVAFHTETGEEMVVYEPLYENEHKLFVRPLKMFLEKVEVDGKKQPRFCEVV
jgi:hypothetical protein